MVTSGLEQKYNEINKVTLNIPAKTTEVTNPEFKSALPKSLTTLNLRFELSYSSAQIPIHHSLARMVAESFTITNLKLDKVAMFCPEIEAFWRKAFMDNRSIVNLKLSNFANNYSYGDKFLMAIKQRKTRLHSLRLDNFRVNDHLLYYLTAVVRSHHYFDSFELSSRCFEELKDDKKQPLKD